MEFVQGVLKAMFKLKRFHQTLLMAFKNWDLFTYIDGLLKIALP